MPFVVILQILFLIKKEPNNFLSHLKLHYILCYAYISQSLEKGHFPVKSHELPVFIDICFSFSCPFSWRRKCGNRLSLLLIRTYGTSHLMGPVLKLERGAARGHCKSKNIRPVSPQPVWEIWPRQSVFSLYCRNEKRNRTSCGKNISFFLIVDLYMWSH